MARFEATLAQCSAAQGLVPPAAAEVIAHVCAHARFDVGGLAREARHAGTLAIPFVRELTRQVAASSAEAARYVHLGATSQDIIDSGVVLCVAPAARRIDELSRRLGDAAAALAERHAATPTLARTLLQPALPVPFGWKAATWLAPLAPARAQFQAAANAAHTLQFGGAGGTLSSFGADGVALARAMARALGLSAASISWHSARDRFARLGSEAALLTGLAGKIARDVTLLMQPEIGEASEAALQGRGGSSAMPHKRNPAGSLLALEAALRTPGLAATLLSQLGSEHERGLGQWQSQWLVLRDLLCLCSSALAAMAEVLEGLEVNAAAMLRNIERTHGLAFSELLSVRLAATMGKGAAHKLVEELSKRALLQGTSLLAAAKMEGAGIEDSELERLFEPAAAFGSAPAMIQATLADWRRARR